MAGPYPADAAGPDLAALVGPDFDAFITERATIIERAMQLLCAGESPSLADVIDAG
jgi:hypothetical protein